MTKKTINQNTSHEVELINLIESGIVFSNKPIDRIKKGQNIADDKLHKKNDLELLIKEISSIQNCNSSNIILGEGNINSPLMFVGEAPSSNKNSTNNSTLNEEVDTLFKKMLNAINILKYFRRVCFLGARGWKSFSAGPSGHFWKLYFLFCHTLVTTRL